MADSKIQEEARLRYPKVIGRIIATGDLNDYRREAFIAGAEWQKKQEPAEWSEEDEKMRNELITILNGGKVTSGTYLSEYAAWLKSLRPPQYCENCRLKKSVQGWKPSEEQIYSLGTVVKGYDECTVGSVGYNLKELYEHLKKL